MKIAVTGGAGFIGGHLVQRLASAAQYEIVVLDNLRRACVPDPGFAEAGNVRFLCGDIRDPEAVADALGGCEIVFHLAAQSNVIGCAIDARYSFETNVGGTFLVLEAAKAAGVRRLIFTSSREVYGEPDELPVAESSPLRPKNGYGTSKAAGELYCRQAAADGLETVILRLANVYGPRDRDRVIPLFLDAARAGTPLTVYGGYQVLDFVWVDDIVEALLKAAVGPWLREPVNLGSGVGTTVLELAHRTVALTASSAPIHVTPSRQIEVSRFVADITRACRLLGCPAPEDPLRHLPDLAALAPGAPLPAA